MVDHERREIMGIGIDSVRGVDVVERVLSQLDRGRGGCIVTPNVDILRQASRSRSLRTLLASADIVVADGAPVVWASRLQGTPLPERIAGSTLLEALCAAAGPARRRVLLLGGTPTVAALAARSLRARVPGLECSWHCPPFGFESAPQQLHAVIDAINVAQADIVFCGFGFPKQEQLMARLHRRFPETWFCASGGAIAFTAGVQPRAPAWVQRAGLEWLHRLAHEPRRLFGRYVVHDLPFAVQLLGQSLLRRRELTDSLAA